MAKRGVLFLMLAAAVLGLCGIASAQKTITLGVYQEPENLNTYIGVQTVITYVHKPFDLDTMLALIRRTALRQAD